MQVQVRRVRDDEWREYRALRLEALKDSPLAFVEQYDDALAQPDRFWQDRVRRGAQDPLFSTFAAVLDGEGAANTFVGKTSCFIDTDATDPVVAHVIGVYVSPSARGGQVAEKLMTRTVEWAYSDAGADRVRLFVLEDNTRALAFYRRMGFTPTGGTMSYPPDPRYTELEMEHQRSAPSR
ncbi:GNAT family N-acetyltransferase [Phytoactinopolyspora limicola]|uniref:GNAT family N-acetyltransferase n=1 Tax=Phytoactinopolyspora limicola TaxID=2715536 RepID=UPI00140A5E46|nr:GNAT family N-acetyltransferase [Phytoactinopolyspora limicola]